MAKIIKTPKDYSKGKIYRIISLEPNDNHFYIGSTTQNLSSRMACHRNDAKRKPNIKVYKHFNSVNFNCKIDLIEEVICKNKSELDHKENEYILMYKDDPNCLNSINAVHSKKYHEEYYKENRLKILQQQREPNLCSCGRNVSHNNMRRHLKSKVHLSNNESNDDVSNIVTENID